MTEPRHTATGADEVDEVAAYVAAVRDALADLPAREREELLEDLRAHLTEVAAEGDLPLWNRIGPPWEYAAELRSAAHPELGRPARRGNARLDAWRRRARERLAVLDTKLGPMFGHERASEFLRLLLPAWWVVRGYLAAMLVVAVLDDGHRPGLLPRLADSTLVGLVVLAGFVLGSLWLARREDRLGRWPRRALYAGSALVVLFGLSQAASVDGHERWWYGPQYVYSEYNPYEEVTDVIPVDEHGRVLTNVRLLDQNGDPLDIAWWNECGDTPDYDEYGMPVITYPRCPDSLRWFRLIPPDDGVWASPAPVPEAPAPAKPEATVTPGSEETATPSPPGPSSEVTARPSPDGDAAPAPSVID